MLGIIRVAKLIGNKFWFFFTLHLLMLLLLVNTTKGQDFMHTNSLINETSKYLLQHAHNPVDWVRWDKSVFSEENKSGKLIVVSIGYSSCHWCHVMEEETFESNEVADYMNSNFVSVKVDREENPDIDMYYMRALQLMTGSGGWPLNVVCLPDGRPVYGGTYHGKDQWIQVLTNIKKFYDEKPDEMIAYADKLEQGIKSLNPVALQTEEVVFEKEKLLESLAVLSKEWDLINGGMTRESQKFIRPSRLLFLMKMQALQPSAEKDQYIGATLQAIIKGGIFDPIEGGFYRYTVDSNWRIPHFEKMLYDNAQLLSLMAQAYKRDKNPEFKKRSRAIKSFLDLRLLNDTGAYGASIDADSSEGEGRYYAWERETLIRLIDDLPYFEAYYGIDWKNPWEHKFYLLRNVISDSDFKKKYGLSEKQFLTLKSNWEKLLKAEMSKRELPGIDNKIITSWNALTVIGLADAYDAFGDKDYLIRAQKVFDFLEERLIVKDRVYHTYQEGSVKVEGFIEDYAFLIAAALKLYSSTTEIRYLNFADKFALKSMALFDDPNSEMFQYTSENSIYPSMVQIDDGVIPSPNSTMANNLFLLGILLENKIYAEQADKMLKAASNDVLNSVSDYSVWASLYASKVFPFVEIIVMGDKAKAYTSVLLKNDLPNSILQASVSDVYLPLFENRYVAGETLIYVCKNKVCRLPTSDLEVALKEIKAIHNEDDSNAIFRYINKR